MRGEFGAGISAGWIASVEPSSTRRVRRVKTERTRKATMKQFMMRNMRRARRIVAVVGGGEKGLRVGVVEVVACAFCGVEEERGEVV